MESWLILQTLQQLGMSLFVCRTVTKHDNESSVEGQALAAATCVRTTKAITAVKEITSEPHQEANNFIARNEHRRPDAVVCYITKWEARCLASMYRTYFEIIFTIEESGNASFDLI